MIYYGKELYHYGVKGQKWGVRRTKKQLLYDRGSINSILKKKLVGMNISNGIVITECKLHVADRGEERSIRAKDIIDAVKNPLYIRKAKPDNKKRLSRQFIGVKATVAVNPETGVLTTAWPTSKKVRKKYGGVKK